MSTILFAALSFAAALSPPDGSVTGVSVAPAKAETGQEIAITVTGTNPCGAVHLVTGDGAAVTHPITGLPSTHAHMYRRPGKYTITAQGMGNCDGEATTTIEITGKPLEPDPPPAPRAEVSGLEIAPQPGRVGEAVTFTIRGTGACEAIVEFGDGNTRKFKAPLPQRIEYTYAAEGRYTVHVLPIAPCEGRESRELEVVNRQPEGRLARLTISPAPATAGQPVSIRIEGSGRCAYEMDFGDGNTEPLNTELPYVLSRYYHAPGMYTVTAAATAPCRGGDRLTFEVRRAASGPDNITGIDVSQSRASAGAQITFTVRGTGECRVGMDFGDGNRRAYVGRLPMRVPHVYDRTGQYVVVASAEPPCGGTGRLGLTVEGRGPV